jgi:hypothetical protein
MFFNLFKRGIANANGLFAGHYVDVRTFYVLHFNKVPCVSFIGEIDTAKAYRYIQDNYRNGVAGIYQHTSFDHDKKNIFFNNTVFVLKDNRMIELANNYCHMLFGNKQYDWADKVMKDLSAFRQTVATNDKTIGFARSNQVN